MDNSTLKPINQCLDIGKGFKHPGDPESIVEMGLNEGLDKTTRTKQKVSPSYLDLLALQDTLEATGGVCMLRHVKIRGLCRSNPFNPFLPKQQRHRDLFLFLGGRDLEK